MRKLILAAALSCTCFAAPAFATDNSGYVGIEGGVIFPQKQNLKGAIDFTNAANPDRVSTDIARLKYKPGFDIDAIAGYDFGMFRLEGELGYKHSKLKSVTYDPAFITAINTPAGTTYTTGADFGLGNGVSVYSAMANALLDLGGNQGIGAYLGGGAGYASVHELGDSQGKFAWQLIAGAYAPISDNVDIGVKYRYFRTGRLNLADSAAFAAGATTCGALPCSAGTVDFAANDRFASHSLLASLVYNFGARAEHVAEPMPVAAPPPPPPAPAAPATQTCPDGSIILATDVCPAPPPPPPPPPATSGERGQ
jgi:opacity protein-like surface antigen